MRFLMTIKVPKGQETGAPPKPELMAGMAKLTEEMIEAGVLLMSGGLQPSSQGARLVCTGGKLSVVDGPFAETKELIGGFAVLRAESKQEAIELAKRCVDVHTKAGVDIDMEVRPLFDPPDLAPSKR